MLRAQLEERKKAILQRINQEGKDKVAKVCTLRLSSQALHYSPRFTLDHSFSVGCI